MVLAAKCWVFRNVQEYSDLPPNTAKAVHQAWLTVKSNRILQLKHML